MQIYQELVQDSAGQLNTSFLRRFKEVKDNRLRPKGFDPAVFAKNPSPFIQQLAELPGQERFDPYYTDPQLTGADQIEYLSSLWMQKPWRVSIRCRCRCIASPSHLFTSSSGSKTRNRGPGKKNDIQRLYYLTSHLDVNAVTDDQGQPVLQAWKLRIAIANSTDRIEGAEAGEEMAAGVLCPAMPH